MNPRVKWGQRTFRLKFGGEAELVDEQKTTEEISLLKDQDQEINELIPI